MQTSNTPLAARETIPPMDLPNGRLARNFYLEDFPVGRIFDLGEVSTSAEEIIEFAKLYDPQTFHTNPDLAAYSGFQGLVASGWQTAGLCTRLVCKAFLADTDCLGSPGVRGIRWLQPVRPGMTLQGRVEVLEQNFSKTKPDRGLTVQRWLLSDVSGSPVFECEMMIVFGRRPEPQASKPQQPGPEAAEPQIHGTKAAAESPPRDEALEQWRRQAQSLWFGEGSCTGGKEE